ncbi:GNAT family N-acetyltransferase [Lottiidibacillus patelloidae]|uniref:GNAT family N-acetyltransferase n=1 Tax=Lottiidibacillus patelloidae TaxID=2670334 RepID=A0A263BX95_9BACI|nr:GNAT family N-acetyltransferase [Lottiidibacillus patelloidae]OZM58290.1 GNAT family N-acetyltransferase [Lottiidibacillus patelloidae]
MALVTKLVSTEKEYEDALLVRREVFIDEQNVPEDLEIDEYEKDCFHFISYDETKPVAAGRLRKIAEGGKVERICVLKPYRKHGIGINLMEALEATAKEQNIPQLILNSQTHAEKFYLKLGYQPVSDEFMEAGIPHVKMKKSI